jgi:hypothetical protein
VDPASASGDRAGQLGRPLARHLGRFDVSGGLAGPAIGAMVILAFSGLLVSTMVDAANGDFAADSLTYAFAVDTGGIAAGALATWLALRRSIRKSRQIVDAYEGGLAWTFNGEQRVIAWHDIAAARYVRMVRTSGLVKSLLLHVRLRDGRKITFHSDFLCDVQGLAAHVGKHVRLV